MDQGNGVGGPEKIMAQTLKVSHGFFIDKHHESYGFWANDNDQNRRVVTLNDGLVREGPPKSP